MAMRCWRCRCAALVVLPLLLLRGRPASTASASSAPSTTAAITRAAPASRHPARTTTHDTDGAPSSATDESTSPGTTHAASQSVSRTRRPLASRHQSTTTATATTTRVTNHDVDGASPTTAVDEATAGTAYAGQTAPRTRAASTTARHPASTALTAHDAEDPSPTEDTTTSVSRSRTASSATSRRPTPTPKTVIRDTEWTASSAASTGGDEAATAPSFGSQSASRARTASTSAATTTVTLSATVTASVTASTTPPTARQSAKPAVRSRMLSDEAEGAPSTQTAEETATARNAPLDWEEFKRKHNKTYHSRDELKRMLGRGGRALNLNGSDIRSDEDRMNMFLARKLAVEEHNKNNKTYKRTLNNFADMTPQEVLAKHTGLVLANRKPKGLAYDGMRFGRTLGFLPPRFDWRDKGALTEPRNQGSCGCCWAFAATAAMEAKNFIRTKRLVALSEQNLLDCDTINDKCDGGTPWDAFDWIQNNGGQEESDKYPYEVLPDTCRQDRGRMYKLQVRGYMSVVPTTEENIMASLISEGPLTVAVNAALASFQDYQEGVYSDPECSAGDEFLHHSMVLVGFGEDPWDGPYWTLRNSWGRDWGEGGYIRVNRRNNLCGIMTYAVFPSLE